MYAHILVPVSLDEDKDLTGLLAAVRHLAGQNAKVTLLHVLEDIPAYASSYLPFGYQDETRSQIETALTDIGGGLQNLTGLVLQGKPEKIIPDYVIAEQVDCVVLAPRSGGNDLKPNDLLHHLLRLPGCSLHIHQ